MRKAPTASTGPRTAACVPLQPAATRPPGAPCKLAATGPAGLRHYENFRRRLNSLERRTKAGCASAGAPIRAETPADRGGRVRAAVALKLVLICSADISVPSRDTPRGICYVVVSRYPPPVSKETEMPPTPQPTTRPRRGRLPLASAPVKLAGFAALLVVLFGTAALAGGAIDPDRGDTEHRDDAATATDGGHPGSGEHTGVPAARREDSAPAHSADKKTRPVRGLAVAENGLRLAVANRELRRARTERVRFRIVDERGQTVRDFDVEHTKRMHVIVVRRDLAAFQHLHPTQNRDGSWSIPVRLSRAGSYRLFADFSHEGQPATLASDVRRRPSRPAAAAATGRDGHQRWRLRGAPAERSRAPGQRGVFAVQDRQGRPGTAARAVPRRGRAPRRVARG